MTWKGHELKDDLVGDSLFVEISNELKKEGMKGSVGVVQKLARKYIENKVDEVFGKKQ